MAAAFALSWHRSEHWAELLHKLPGRAVSDYHSRDYSQVEETAAHINSLDPTMDCKIEVFTS
jgi:hypothetical protein